MSLERQHGGKTQVRLATEAIVPEEGRYVYCVADATEKVSLGKIGIEGHEVYTITGEDICAVVHTCPAQPYQSDDQEMVKGWVMTHQMVVDIAWQRWGTILPLGFDTIIGGELEKSAEQNVKEWLKQEHERLKNRIDRVRGKAEYGVQVFWNPNVIAQNLRQISPEIAQLEQEIRTKPRGMAYVYRYRLENLVKREMENKASECFKDFYTRIVRYASDIRVEKTKASEPNLKMIMNLSCLVPRDSYTQLGKELDEINQMEGFRVRFTGPWPPYSFVGAT